jgi:hypothetical protein
MDKKLATLIQNEATIALEAIAAKHGMTVRAHGGSLGDLSTILKFEFKPAGEALADAERKEFESYATVFGLAPSDYGATFVANNKQYRLVGFDLKRRKFPILAVGPDGKRICFTDLVVDRIVKQRMQVAS